MNKEEYFELFKRFWLEGPNPESVSEQQMYWMFQAMWDVISKNCIRRKDEIQFAVSTAVETFFGSGGSMGTLGDRYYKGRTVSQAWTQYIMDTKFGGAE